MSKKLLFLGSILYLLIACGENTGYQVELKLSNLEKQNIYAVFESSDSKWVDTIVCEPLEPVSIIKKEGEYRTLTIYFENHKDRITIYLEPNKKIKVSGDALYPALVQVKGTPTNELLSDFRKKASSLLKEKTELSGAIDTASESQPERHTEHLSRLANINYELGMLAESFIRKHPDDKASAVLIQEYIFDAENPLRAEELINILNPDLYDWCLVKELIAYCEKAGRTMIGAQAPDFNMKNIYGLSYTPNSFLDKYFILVFTQTWCDSSQINALMLDKIVADFSPEDVEIMWVSLDEKPQEVRDFFKKDTKRWNIVTDSAGQAIDLLNRYNVNSLPRCFLIDKKGKILLKTDNGAELKQVLDGLISNSNEVSKNQSTANIHRDQSE